MKKIISLTLVAIMLVASVFCFAACRDKEDVVDYVKIKLTDEQYAYGVNKNDPALLATVNSVLAELKTTGELDKIVNKYFSGDKENIKTFDAGKEDTSKNQLVVATNTPFSPFEYKTGDKYCGIDIEIEIAALIAEEMGAELVIKDMNFDAVLTAVETGKADIVMAGLTVSEEREEQVTFSDTYYNASQVLIVKAGDTTFADCKTVADVEAKLNAMNKDTIIGYQNGTTGGLYVEGDADWGFAGFPVTAKGYDSAVSATQALVNGQIDFVMVDEGPAQIIVKSMNE
ncbi:MAG: transporter substrate-binding domain-containing protein [Clostridia bacterium]|nr:transporter substrate-binding domain-containing protein [Clostridia bacterium]